MRLTLELRRTRFARLADSFDLTAEWPRIRLAPEEAIAVSLRILIPRRSCASSHAWQDGLTA